MWSKPDYHGQEILLANQKVEAGEYKRIDGNYSHRIKLDKPDRLPASCDGRVACYIRVDEHRRSLPIPTAPTRLG